MRRKFLSTLVIALLAMPLFANEGMWLLHLLKKINEAEMQGMGLNLTAEEIYSVNNSSVKDAVVRLNGGSCTAEVISDQGLVLTNHHCAYGAVQSLSSVDHDYLTDGFWAFKQAEELPIDGMTVGFLQYIEDVSERVLTGVTPEMTEEERNAIIGAAINEIRNEAVEKGYDADVKGMYYGNEFYLFTYKTYSDIRLVGVPPESIGKFGGDTDNWMWPRHTGDFSMLRIYADADNNPAGYSDSNVAYKPKHHLPVSLDGVKANDFTMILGYPGSTDRYLSSYGVEEALEVSNPTVVDIRTTRLETMKKHMDADKAVRIQYASKYAQVANYWKYFQGQSRGLKKLHVYDQKKELENEFAKWVAQDEARTKMYGNALQLMEEYYAENSKTEAARAYVNEVGFGSDMTILAWRFNGNVAASYSEETKSYSQDAIDAFKGRIDDLYKDFDAATEKDVFINLFSMWQKNLPKEQQPDIFELINKKYKGSVQVFADKMFATSFLASPEKLKAFLAKPSKKVVDKDLAMMTMKSVLSLYRTKLNNPEIGDKYDRGYRLFVDGLRKMQPNKKFYPDANSTMRLTYGKVGDYYPADAVHYDYVTTANGIVQKYDPKDPEFVVPAKLIDMIKEGDYSNYADENGNLVTCFISDNDITGGNSGSPVLNGDGHLIGLAFDGNWEAMSGDIAFEHQLQRTISVDIRYVMFIVDKFAGAKNIIEEIDFVKTEPQPVKMAPVKAEEEVH